MAHVPSPSYSITIRVEIDNKVGMFARLATALSYAGGDLGSIDIVRVEKGRLSGTSLSMPVTKNTKRLL